MVPSKTARDTHSVRFVSLDTDCAVYAEKVAPGTNIRCQKFSEETEGRAWGISTTLNYGVHYVTLLSGSISFLDSGEWEGGGRERKNAMAVATKAVFYSRRICENSPSFGRRHRRSGTADCYTGVCPRNSR